MAYQSFKYAIEQQLAGIRSASLYKTERFLLSPQGAEIRVPHGNVLNLCANNYLGLANHPEVVQAAIDGGGKVVLKATNPSGQLTAFNFGPADTHNSTRANLTTDVTMVGERVGQSMTTINGGFAPFLGFVPVKTHIEVLILKVRWTRPSL